MRNRFSTSITALLLAALMLGGVLFAPATALAARSKAKTVKEFKQELSSEQLVVGRDTNRYRHNKNDFSYSYVLDEEYQKVLFDMASPNEEAVLREKLDIERTLWTGSCYGVSGTIVLNYLAQYKGRNVLSAAQMQPGAEKYFDIGAPKYNPDALNHINFLMLSQFVEASIANGAVTQAWSAFRKNGERYYRKLNEAILTAIKYIDEGKPFQLGYSYPKKNKDGTITTKGHAIVCHDYYVTRDLKKGDYLLYLKCYDENDRSFAIRYGEAHACFIKLKAKLNADGSVASVSAPYKDRYGNECIFLYSHNYEKNTGIYLRKLITSLRVRNMETIYYNLKNSGAGKAGIYSAALDASSSPVLTLYDVDAYYDNYRIRPFVYKDALANTVDYADSCGRLYKFAASDALDPDFYDDDEDFPVEPPELIDFPPVPVDEGNENLPFGNMVDFDKDEPGYRYETYEDEEEGGLDIEIDLLKEGKVQGSNKVYDGYDIALEGDKTLGGVSLDYGGSFASVGGEGIELVRFSSDGRLRDVDAATGGGSMELYFGTENEATEEIDMFRMGLDNFGFLQVYDTQDDPAFADCIVLRTDGLANGFDFTFYKNELISDDYEGYSTDGSEQDTWIKIESFKNPQTGELGVKVWTEEEDGDVNTLPTFSEPPIFTEELHERPSMPNYPSGGGDSGNDSSSDYVPAARQTVHSNDGAVALSAISVSAGDALIAQPLTSGVDYNFMLALAGNNEVVKMYDIHLASGQSALGGGAELCFALGARYANEEFTLVHKKADGSAEYFYAQADGSGNVCFTGIYSLSPFMLVKGRLSATAVTTPIAEVPATGGAPFGAYSALLGAGLLLVSLSLLRSRRKYTEK